MSGNTPPAPWNDVSWEEWNDWHWQIRNRITTVEELARVIHLTDQERQVIEHSLNTLRMAITPYYASLMTLPAPSACAPCPRSWRRTSAPRTR
jgi:lysine 2,3-aminomutase